jgi:hypothetical protein
MSLREAWAASFELLSRLRWQCPNRWCKWYKNLELSNGHFFLLLLMKYLCKLCLMALVLTLKDYIYSFLLKWRLDQMRPYGSLWSHSGTLTQMSTLPYRKTCGLLRLKFIMNLNWNHICTSVFKLELDIQMLFILFLTFIFWAMLSGETESYSNNGGSL